MLLCALWEMGKLLRPLQRCLRCRDNIPLSIPLEGTPCLIEYVKALTQNTYQLAWRFMGSSKWGYKSPNMGYKYRYTTYNPAYHYP